MFKGCLKYNIVPFIIEDNLKMFYYRGNRFSQFDTSQTESNSGTGGYK